MAYTALSRVRKLEGLYLLDFEPRSVWADRKAVQEYNRLRAKYEPLLPMMEIPEERKLDKKAVRMFDVGDFFAKDLAIGARETKQRATSKVVRKAAESNSAAKKKRRTEDTPAATGGDGDEEVVRSTERRVVDVNIGWSDEEDGGTERLRGKVCFADVAAVALRSSELFESWLKSRIGCRKVKKALKADDVGIELVKAVVELNRGGEKFDDERPHDAFKFLDCLLKSCGNNGDLWGVKWIGTAVYDCCGASDESGRKEALVFVMEPSETPLKLEDLKSKPVSEGATGICPKCQQEARVLYHHTYEESVMGKAKLVVVRLMRFWKADNGETVRSESIVEDIDPSRVKVGGAYVKLVSAVEYEEVDGLGHYKAIRRSGDGWELVDEGAVTKRVRFPKNLKNVHYFVGERLEDFGFLGSRIVQNVVEATGNVFWAESADEETFFENSWHVTGLSPESDYYELPAIKARTYETSQRIGWARYHGHLFRAYDVKADGNCLFRAVSLGMFGTQKKHGEVRRAVVGSLRSHWNGLAETDDGIALLPAMLEESWTWLTQRTTKKMPTMKERERFEAEVTADLKSKVTWFCDELAKDKVWGGDESLYAISRVYDVSVVVLHVDSKIVVRQARPGRPEMYLRFASNHYHFLEPSKKCLELPEP